MAPFRFEVNVRRYYDPSYPYEVTMRTIDGQWYFPVDDVELQRAIVGAMAVAQRRTSVRIHAFTFMSNHFHAIYSIDSHEQFSAFMDHLHAALARLANRRWRRSGPVWSGRAHVVPIAQDEKSQLERLDYVLGQAVRAGQVAHPREWQGASSARWLLDGEPLCGTHIDRTRQALASRNRPELLPDSDFEAEVAPELTPLPCFEGRDEADWREALRSVAANLPSQVNAQPAEPQLDVPAAEIDGLAPRPRRSPPPVRRASKAIHTRSAAVLVAYREARKLFNTAYETAALRLRSEAAKVHAGGTGQYVQFPDWSFPPAGPAVCGRRDKSHHSNE